MRTSYRWLGILALLCFGAAGVAAPAEQEDAARIEFFEKKVRPLLVDNCYNCHSADTNSKGGLRVDDRNGLLARRRTRAGRRPRRAGRRAC